MPKSQPAWLKRARARRNKMPQRKQRRKRIPRPLALKPHTFVERLPSDLIQVDTEATATGLFKSFNLDLITQSAQYKSLFEYYTINKVVVEFRYKANGIPANLSSGSSIQMNNECNPLLYFKVDHNDINPDPLLAMKESMKTHEHQLTNSRPNFTIQLKPAVQAETFKSSTATTYSPKWGQQLSSADGTIPHFGLKVYAVGFKNTYLDPGQIEVNYKMYFTMKNNE
jgi:hypothetical protein